MIIQCENCTRKFIVNDAHIPPEGRTVKCGYCSVTWHQLPVDKPPQAFELEDVIMERKETNDNPLPVIKEASDGKTYKFLGTQWAVLLPSGKTGIFAKKKITRELNKIIGRKTKTTRKKEIGELNPSSTDSQNDKRLPDIYKPKEGIGFFGFIFLLIIIGFSVIGVLKTFENDLLNIFPETQYIFQLLDKQLEYISETVKNMIVILNDLIDSY